MKEISKKTDSMALNPSKKEVDRLKKENLALKSKKEGMEKEITVLRAENTKLTEKYKKIKKRIKHCEDEIKRCGDAIQDVESRESEKEDTKKLLLVEVEKEKCKFEGKLDLFKKCYEGKIEELENQIERLNQRITSQNEVQDDAKNQKQVANELPQSMATNSNNLEKRKHTMKLGQRPYEGGAPDSNRNRH